MKDSLPLSGKVLLVPRPRGQAREMIQSIRRLGGKPYVLPLVEIHPRSDNRAISALLRDIEREPDFVVFMSVNGVRVLFSQSRKMKVEKVLRENIEKSRIVAVGPATAREVNNEGLDVDIIPAEFSSKGLVSTFNMSMHPESRIVLIRAMGGSAELADGLRHLGHEVSEHYIYTPAPTKSTSSIRTLAEEINKGKLHAILFTSPSTARNLMELAQRAGVQREITMGLQGPIVLAAIGPATATTLTRLGFRVDVIPKRFLADDLVKSVGNYWSSYTK